MQYASCKENFSAAINFSQFEHYSSISIYLLRIINLKKYRCI